MKIIFLPMNCAGMVDLDTHDIFISNRYNIRSVLDTIRHELAHILRDNELHDKKWYDIYRSLGGIKSFSSIYSPNVGNVTVVQNVGNVTGIQNILLDFHYLQAYRKFSQRVLATEGNWEVKGNNKIRLFPTPRGTFPVFIEYFPTITRFKNATVKEILKRKLVAEAKIILGNARSKFGNIPAPDGGNLSLNGDALRTEGEEERRRATEEAWMLSDPLRVHIPNA